MTNCCNGTCMKYGKILHLCHLCKFTVSYWCLLATVSDLKTARKERMLIFERPPTYLRNWVKCIPIFIFKKQDPSFTYEVIVVDDGSKDQTTKVRKRSVLPR